MADIARLAKVSESTVSRALRDSPLVNQRTKDRVRAIARQHNYQVDTSARNFRLGRTQTVAVLIPLSSKSQQSISDLFFLDLLGSIADALVEAGYDLLLSKPSGEDWNARFLESRRADGILVIGQAGHHEVIQGLARQQAPLVVWGGQLDGQLYCTVGSDNESGGFRAVKHLLDLGRRR
ncbi:MAG: LacI family DNA-binding transcriptional regulator, partial [Myxococcota bacterium]